MLKPTNGFLTVEPLHIAASRHGGGPSVHQCRHRRNRQTVKLTLTSSGQNPSEPICSVLSRKRPNRPHIPSSSRNVKEHRHPRDKINRHYQTTVWHYRPTSHPDCRNQNRNSRRRPGPRSVPSASFQRPFRFGERVSRPPNKNTQDQISQENDISYFGTIRRIGARFCATNAQKSLSFRQCARSPRRSGGKRLRRRTN